MVFHPPPDMFPSHLSILEDPSTILCFSQVYSRKICQLKRKKISYITQNHPLSFIYCPTGIKFSEIWKSLDTENWRDDPGHEHVHVHDTDTKKSMLYWAIANLPVLQNRANITKIQLKDPKLQLYHKCCQPSVNNARLHVFFLVLFCFFTAAQKCLLDVGGTRWWGDATKIKPHINWYD